MLGIIRIVTFTAMMIGCLFGEAVAKEQSNVGEYYYNPNGGKYYHTLIRCESISEKYHSTMKVITQKNEVMARLQPCPICCIEQHDATISTQWEPDSEKQNWISQYMGTGEGDIVVSTPGKYIVGTDFEAGIYTISVEENAQTYFILENKQKKEYYVSGEAEYTFFLADQTKIEIGASCSIEDIHTKLLFQKQNASYPIKNARYLTCVQMPAYQGNGYSVTALDEKGGKVVFSTIDIERGIEEDHIVDIPYGHEYHFIVEFGIYKFVEFINCHVYIGQSDG